MGSVADKLAYTLSSVEKVKAMLSEKGIDTNVSLDKLLGEKVVQNIAKGNALESDVLLGKTFTNADGVLRTGKFRERLFEIDTYRKINTTAAWTYVSGSGKSVKLKCTIESPNNSNIYAAILIHGLDLNWETQGGTFIYYLSPHQSIASATYLSTGTLRKEIYSFATWKFISGYPATSGLTNNPATYPNAWISGKTITIQATYNENVGWIGPISGYIITD